MHDIGYLGNISTYRIEVNKETLIEVTVPNQSRPRDGRHVVDWDDEVYLHFKPASAVVLTK